MKLVLVVGPPRSGTSVTARILHERLGICMGHWLVPGNEGNPKGFYEDYNYVDLIKEKNLFRFQKALNHGCQVVGVKSPELAFMNLDALNADQIIRTRRPRQKIAQSILTHHRPQLKSLTEAFDVAERYESAINEALMNYRPGKVWEIFYDRRREEDDIEGELRFACASVVLT